MAQTAQRDTDASVVIPPDMVEATIKAFTELDASGDKRTMNKMARRLGKEQPALLAHAAKLREDHGEATGEAAVFYGTLVWAFFDRAFDAGPAGKANRKCPRLTKENIEAAQEIVDTERGKVEALADQPIHLQTAPALVERQPHVYAKLSELIEEDVREDAMTLDTAVAIFPPTQVVLEAFDAALEGRRPGERLGPIVRETAKVGRNEPCPCGSGKKYKKCCANK